MATASKPPAAPRRKLTAKPQPEIDRDRLRDAINDRYENTLRYLGR